MTHFFRLFSAMALCAVVITPGAVGEAAPAPAAQTTEIISISTQGRQGNDGSAEASISADGRWVAFESLASNLVQGDANRAYDAFVHDRLTGEVSLVSISLDGKSGNANSMDPAISADGRYIAFSSRASNLISSDTNEVTDIFVRDLQTGVTTLVSISSSGEQGNDHSEYPSISANGRYIAFSSSASNFSAGDTSRSLEIFVHDRQTGETTRASVSSNGTVGFSLFPSMISADGSTVAFASSAPGLVSDKSNRFADIYVRDLRNHLITRVSISTGGEGGNEDSISPSISADGRYVAFYSEASNLVSEDTNQSSDIFIHDRQTGETTRVSVSSSGEQGNGLSTDPSISADGRYVAFSSNASNLVVDDLNNNMDVFVHDCQTGSTVLVSVTAHGEQANSGSMQPTITPGGRYVAFTSFSTNLAGQDTNERYDVFLRDRGEPQAKFSLSGVVMDPNSQPIAGAQISAGAGLAVTTGPDGSFRLDNLPAGNYPVRLEKENTFFTPPFYDLTLLDDTEIHFTAYPCLAPSGMNVCELRAGDILLSRSTRESASFTAGGSYFTHAALYLGELPGRSEDFLAAVPRLAEGQGKLDEAHAANEIWDTGLIQTSFWSGEGVLDWAVLRPAVAEGVKQERVIPYARDLAADNNITFDLSAPKMSNDRYYCSKLVWRAYLDVEGGLNLEVNTGLDLSGPDPWVTPDDLYFSTRRGSFIMQQKPGVEPNRLVVRLRGPAHLTLIDPHGLRTGYNPDTGGVVQEIPLAEYFPFPESQVETITAAGAGGGWTVQVSGNENGDYQLEAIYLIPGSLFLSSAGGTASGQMDSFDLEDPIFGRFFPLLEVVQP